MHKLFSFVAAFAICAAPALAQSTTVQTKDAPVVKLENGDVFMEEVPSQPAKSVKRAETKEYAQKAQQAQRNAAELMMENQVKNVLPPSDGTAPGAITPAYIPFSTVPGGPYGGGGSVVTPFNIRDYSYGGNSQSFGAPIFSGVEVPNPALQYPAGMPFGGRPGLLQVSPGSGVASPFPPGVTTIMPTPTTVVQPGNGSQTVAP